MSELNEELYGRSMESLVEILRGLPNLRRLGTVSSKAACLFDLSRDACRLDEIVLTLEPEDVYHFFKMFLALVEKKRRTSIRRLAVHFQASDGVSRLKPDAESMILGGWYNIAKLIQEDGWIVFSVGAQQLTETAPVQFPWFFPQKFSFDSVAYAEGQLPVSTPLWRSLPYYGIEGVSQPGGTLVSGTMKKARVGGEDLGVSVRCGDDPGSPGLKPSRRLSDPMLPTLEQSGASGPLLSPSAGSKPLRSAIKLKGRSSRIGATSTAPAGLGWEDTLSAPPDWLGLQMVEVMEAMAHSAPV